MRVLKRLGIRGLKIGACNFSCLRSRVLGVGVVRVWEFGFGAFRPSPPCCSKPMLPLLSLIGVRIVKTSAAGHEVETPSSSFEGSYR